MSENRKQKKAAILAAIRNEETISVSSIQKAFGIGFPLAAEIFAQEIARRKGRSELHLHTTMSAFGGLDHPLGFFEAASERGVNAIAVTDLGSVQSYRAADCAGKEYGIKAIFGAEFYIDGKGDEDVAHRVVVLAKNRSGIKRVYGLITISQTDFQNENIPFLPFDEIKRERQDVFVGLAVCDRGIASLLDRDFNEDVEKLVSTFDYVEIVPPEVCSILLGDDSQEYCKGFLKRIVSVASELGIPVIASDDACYVEAEDAFQAGAVDHSRAIDALRRKSIKEPVIKGRRFRSTEEMLDSLSFLGEETAQQLVIVAPNRISAQIETISPFEGSEALIPLLDDADQKISEICRERLEETFPKGFPFKYWSRLRKELRAIKKSHSASAFLTIHLISQKAKADGRMMGNRGMAGNSLVAYLLGITDVNPLKTYYYCPKCGTWEGHAREFHRAVHSSIDAPPMRCLECGERLSSSGDELPMEMLFGLAGDKTPDIDMEFSSDYLRNAHNCLRELFGESNVVRTGTIETLPRKSSALRAGDYLKDSDAKSDSGAFELAVGACMTPKRLMGQHPCGYIVLPKGHEWNEFTPLDCPAGYAEFGIKITHYPWDEIAASGQLYKFDLLGNGSLDLLERLTKETGVDGNSIRLDDQRLISVLCGSSAETTFKMVPGCKGDMVREVITIAKPSTFSDLVKIKGIVHGTGVWECYKAKLISGEISISDEMVTNRDDLFLALLSRGLKRELAFAIAERVRKGRGLTDEMKEAMMVSGLPNSYTTVCESVQYLFPKAHIIGFLRRELRLVFFKLNYPEQYERIYHELFD